MIKKEILLLLLAFITGCTLASVDVEVLSERTALENQVLGTYNSIDKEMLLLASVRGVDAAGNIRSQPKHSQEHKDATAAMQVLAFHADDIQAFKQIGWVGENNEGLLTAFSIDKSSIPDNLKDFAERYSAEEFTAVVSQCNSAREVIMRRVIDMNESLTIDDMPKIGKIFAELYAENAMPGEKIQDENGTWRIK